MNYWTQSAKNIYVAAHRGWRSKYPENTMESFRAALSLGVDQLELDIRVTKDNELVVIHDPTVDRTTNGTGRVCDFTLAELKALDAGSHKGEEFRGCKIPTLLEFMELIKDLPTMTVDFELKEYPVDGNDAVAYDVCDRVLRLIDEYGYTDRCVINCFNAKLHEYIVKTYGNKYRQHVYFPLWRMGEEVTMDPYQYGYCVCMFDEVTGKGIASREQFEKMRACGIRTWAGAGVKDEAGVLAAIENGAELITCDNPDEILAILRRHGYHK